MGAVGGMVFVAALVAPHTARACGGFFCQSVPVAQTGEQIIYAIEDDGALTMSVRINYQGDAPEFAWILPVPETPEISLGADVLFDALEGTTRPSFGVVEGGIEGVCRTPPTCAYPPPPPVPDRMAGGCSWTRALRSAATRRAPDRWCSQRARSVRSRRS